MNSKSNKNATLHSGEDLHSLDNTYKEEPTEENYQKIKRYIPKNEYERTHKITILQQIEEERIRAKFHPYANILPLMKKDALMALALDIKKNGLMNDIVLYEKKILDGRNRYIACLKSNVKPKFMTLPEGIDPLDFVKSQNMRRDLSSYTSAERCESGLKLLAIEEERARERQLRELKQFKDRSDPRSGGNGSESDEKKGEAIKIVAKLVRVSNKTLSKAKKIKEIARTNPEIAKKWKLAINGKMPIKHVYEDAIGKKPREPSKQENKLTKKPSKKPEINTILENLDNSLSDFIALKEMDGIAQSFAKILKIRLKFVFQYPNESCSGSSPDGSTLKSIKKIKSTKKIEE